MSMENCFRGKRVLVTEAGRGIGRALVAQLYEYGATVCALSRNPAHLESLQKEFPTIQTRAVDLEDWEETRKAIESFGHVQFLVNNAGLCVVEGFMSIEPQTYDRIFNTNLKAVINVSQVVAKSMIEAGTGGSIVNVSSVTSTKCFCFEGFTVYGASKAALDSLTKGMARELGKYQIRVNSVNPAGIQTDMLTEAWAKYKAIFSKEGQAEPHRYPLGQAVLDMSDIVDMTLFVLSGKVKMLHGESILIDGGYSCT